MTSDDLKSLLYLPREIEHINAEIGKLHGTERKKDLEYNAAVADLRETLQDRRRMCADQLRRLQAFVDSIPDPELHDIFIDRFEKGLPWEKIDKKLWYAAGTTRQRCCRYIKGVETND